MANADHAGGAIIAILRKKLERIEPFLCACVNSCPALLPLRRVTAAARGRRAREDLHSLRSCGTVVAPTCEFWRGAGAPVCGAGPEARRNGRYRRSDRCRARSRSIGTGRELAGRPRSAGLSDRQPPAAGRPATGTIPAGRCGFPAILLTSRDPDVIRSSGSAGWRRASRPAVEPLSRLFASMGDIRDSGWISHISSINGQFAIYDVCCAFCNRRRSIQDYV
jgi:hypothetical protein